MLKTLTLLILTAIVMASVACGPSAEELHQQQKELIQEQKTILLCEDALERRADAIGEIIEFARPLGVAEAEERAKPLIAIAQKDINKFCK